MACFSNWTTVLNCWIHHCRKGFGFIVAICLTCLTTWSMLCAQVNPKNHYVKPYYRSDGTYVEGHYRTNPNNTNRDNYSTLGNTNPWTGKAGWIPPDNNPVRQEKFRNYSNSPSSGGSSFESTSYKGTELKSRSIPSYNPASHSPGVKTITYADGEETFVVTSNSGVRFDRDKSYVFYDPGSHEIRTTQGGATGLLLHGNYRLRLSDGSLNVLIEYQNGLKHGDMIVSDDAGKLKKKCRYEYGDLVYSKFVEDDGRIVEKIGRENQAGTIDKVTKNGILVELFTRETATTTLFSAFDQFSGKKKYELRYGNEGSDGELTIYHLDGKTIKHKGRIVDWEKAGKHLEYDETGVLVSSHTYEGGMLNGEFAYYHPDGKISEKGIYRYNSLEGIAQSFDENGILVRTTSFKDGLLDGKYELYNRGQVSLRGWFASGEKTGLWEKLMPDKTKESMVAYEFHHYDKGQLHGRFKEVHWDSIIVGNYQQGMLDGEYRVYQPEAEFWLGNEPQDSDLTVKGRYFNGMRTSKWQYYYFGGGLCRSGDYVLDKQHGTWKHFLPVLNDPGYEGQGFNGQLMQQDEYYHGELHGSSESFYRIHSEQIPCPKDDLPNDTCFHYRLERIDFKGTYHLGKRSGPFVIRDSLGRIIEEGEYLDDELHGKWTETAYGTHGQKVFSREINYKRGKQDGRNMFWDENGLLIREGWFLDDERVGTWKYFRDNSTSLFKTEIYYDDGVDILYYALSGKPKLDAKYRNGNFSSITTYDSISESPIRHCDFDDCRDSILVFAVTSYSDDTTFQSEYQLFNSDCEFYHDNPLALEAAIARSLKAKESNLVRQGSFKVTLRDGTVLRKGKYYAGYKDGSWEFSHPLSGIKQLVDFEHGVPTHEQFVDFRTSNPYNGTAHIRSFDGKYQIAKIRDGKRDGPTKILDAHGNLIKRIKYDSGVEVTNQAPAP
jgi:antitoxin component YwqK of YwqJK toxin-antitoxin module